MRDLQTHCDVNVRELQQLQVQYTTCSRTDCAYSGLMRLQISSNLAKMTSHYDEKL